jgi:hypothetical protein
MSGVNNYAGDCLDQNGLFGQSDFDCGDACWDNFLEYYGDYYYGGDDDYYSWGSCTEYDYSCKLGYIECNGNYGCMDEIDACIESG